MASPHRGRRSARINLQDLGNLGEFVSAVAVVVSLVYLAIQIRHNTHAVRMSAFHAVTDSFNQLNAAIAQDPELAHICRLGRENLSSLDEDERVRFDFFMLAVFRVFETLYFQTKQRTAEPALWAAEMNSMAVIIGHPGQREWWDSNPLSFTPEFRRFVAREILEKAPKQA